MGSPTVATVVDRRSPAVVERENGLTISAATKVFATPEGGEVRALDGVDLAIRDGEFFVMLGPSGCGKTTLLRAIAGLETLDSGEIYLGRERIDQTPAYARPVNTVFQSYALFPHLTVAQNVAFGVEMDRLPRAVVQERVAEVLALVRLDGLERRRPHQLSGGQQQRVALARSLAKRPRVLLLDEPLAALDLKLRRGMQQELRRLQTATGITFVFVTHDQEEALSLGDRIAVFSGGRPAQVGTPEDVYERPVDRFVADFIGDTTFVTLPAERDGDGLVVRFADGPPVRLPAGRAGFPQAGRVTLAVRPERLRLDGSAPTVAVGTLTELVYMGADLRCTVLLGDGTELAVRVPPPFDGLALTPGAVVEVGAQVGDLRPLAPEPSA